MRNSQLIVKELVSKHANVGAVNKDGKLPVQLTSNNEIREYLETLINKNIVSNQIDNTYKENNTHKKKNQKGDKDNRVCLFSHFLG